jgi:hypothetical protein
MANHYKIIGIGSDAILHRCNNATGSDAKMHLYIAVSKLVMQKCIALDAIMHHDRCKNASQRHNVKITSDAKMHHIRCKYASR